MRRIDNSDQSDAVASACARTRARAGPCTSAGARSSPVAGAVGADMRKSDDQRTANERLEPR